MPNPKAPHPRERTLVWRKVNMRLAALGLLQGYLIEQLYADEIRAAPGDKKVRHTLALRLQGRWKSPSSIRPEFRRKLEDELALPTGALCDEVPLAVVALCPIPAGFTPGQARSPGNDDVADGPFASTFARLREAGATVALISTVLSALTPPLTYVEREGREEEG